MKATIPGISDRTRLAQAFRLHQEGRLSEAEDAYAAYLADHPTDPAALTGSGVGRIRLILARYIAKRGLPDSPGAKADRERQRKRPHAEAGAEGEASGLHDFSLQSWVPRERSIAWMVAAWLTADATTASGTAERVAARDVAHRSTALRIHCTGVARNHSEILSLVVPIARVPRAAA